MRTALISGITGQDGSYLTLHLHAIIAHMVNHDIELAEHEARRRGRPVI